MRARPARSVGRAAGGGALEPFKRSTRQPTTPEPDLFGVNAAALVVLLPAWLAQCSDQRVPHRLSAPRRVTDQEGCSLDVPRDLQALRPLAPRTWVLAFFRTSPVFERPSNGVSCWGSSAARTTCGPQMVPREHSQPPSSFALTSRSAAGRTREAIATRRRRGCLIVVTAVLTTEGPGERTCAPVSWGIACRGGGGPADLQFPWFPSSAGLRRYVLGTARLLVHPPARSCCPGSSPWARRFEITTLGSPTRAAAPGTDEHRFWASG